MIKQTWFGSVALVMYALLADACRYVTIGFRYVFSSFWHAIAVITVTISFGSVIAEVFSGTYTIEFNEVPETLVKSGLGKAALAVRVRDRVARMTAQAHADVQLHAVVIDATTPDLKIAGTEIPLRYVANEIRNFFGIPLLKISGLIFENDAKIAMQQSSKDSAMLATTIQNPTKFRLILHSNDVNESPIFETSGSLEDVIEDAAFETLRAIDPITAAGFLRNRSNEQKIRALYIVDKTIKSSENLETSAWFRLGVNRSNTLPRARLMKAYIFTSMQMNAEAITAFDEAGEEYRRRQSTIGQAYALDGKAFLVIDSTRRSVETLSEADLILRLAEADLYLDQVLNLVPNYDSALFHKAEILGEIAKKQIKNRDCKAAKTIADAESAFNIVTKYQPNFAIAYSSHATLLAQWLNFLLFDEAAAACIDQRPAPWRVLGLPASLIDTLELQADGLFRDSIGYDDLSADAWFRWGLLTNERQLPWERRPETEKMRANRKSLLVQAIFRMNYAVKLDPQNSWYSLRLAGTLNDRANLAEGVERDQYLKKALTAACLSHRVTPTIDSLGLLQSLGKSDEACSG